MEAQGRWLPALRRFARSKAKVWRWNSLSTSRRATRDVSLRLSVSQILCLKDVREHQVAVEQLIGMQVHTEHFGFPIHLKAHR